MEEYVICEGELVYSDVHEKFYCSTCKTWYDAVDFYFDDEIPPCTNKIKI